MDQDAAFNEGWDLLLRGRLAEGWPLFERRPTRLSTIPNMIAPEWKGEDLTGKRIMVWGEQGLGDEIHMVRFIPRLRAMGAAYIILAPNRLNVRAFADVGADQVVARIGDVIVPDHDFWVMMMSLPFRLGVTLDSIPTAPYLKAKPRPGPSIGVAWRGQPLHPGDAHRSMPGPHLLAGIPGAADLVPFGDTQDSLDQVAGLDLVITVDTSWAHMAGALGRPCWLMLAQRALDWRWMRDRTDSPWYPSLRLYRQPAPGDWLSVVSAVRRDLASTVAAV